MSESRNASEISEAETIRLGVDLVSAARRNIGFLRAVAESQWLHEKATVVEAIRRYDELWMPLISDLTVMGSPTPMVLPPLDVEWVWFCHTLNPVSYQQYCESRFSKLIGKPAIFDEENEEYALLRCKNIWTHKYPSEPFENETETDMPIPVVTNEEILVEVAKHRFLYSKISEAYRSEIVYLIAARQRYKGFLYMVQSFCDECARLVPASDILLMWLTHQVCVFVRLNSRMKETQQTSEFLRLGMLRCHRELKLEKSISKFQYDSWRKAWHLYCEFGSKGIKLELRHRGGYCFKGSSLQETVTFHWNDLLRISSLTLERGVAQELRIHASITPPVQAPYLLKCVPDRVTDDSGAMISDVILRMNRYRPQEGRWLSRTVLDHAGRECFVIRIRVGEGFWRRGDEAPSAVKWEDRIIEIREGSWSYVADSIGKAPEKMVGTATPKEPPEQWKAAWKFSTGDELMIGWESSTSTSGLSFCLKNQMSPEPSSQVRLLKGRKMQYQVKNIKSESKDEESRLKDEEEEKEEDEDEEGFVTLVRFTEENPTGRATALLNWKLLVVELLPEEDAVLVLLLCISILRSVSEMKKEDLGCLLIRRRLKEANFGARDWGSVILHPYSCSSSITSPYIQPWYWNNAKAVMASDRADHITRQPASNYSPVEGGDKLYKRVIIS
ncbi:uncharacterized protein LOC126716900 isoform X2 [Quercus robur]|uniref:uncharacterized protein LOC126716900 isoform X2 n=1 Tax=Quercus robur TaxID=38942 RepID=UPI002161B5F1|nr:uncharacterized protein LOC126716900 isoform X2 [Quercus robur]